MKILISNDDGYNALGIGALLEVLSKEHEVVGVAPNQNRSGASHSVTLGKSVTFNKEGEGLYSCSGTPADCIFYSLLGAIDFKPDLILGGINHGPNLGTDVIYSGTVAIARQAALNKIPSMALSYCSYSRSDMFVTCATAFAQKLNWLVGLLKEGHYLNINFPKEVSVVSPWKQAILSDRRYQDYINLKREGNGSYNCSLCGKPINLEQEASNSDWVLTNNSYVTYTLLKASQL